MAEYISISEAVTRFNPPISRQRIHELIRAGRIDAMPEHNHGKRPRWFVRTNNDGSITVRPGKSANGRPPTK